MLPLRLQALFFPEEEKAMVFFVLVILGVLAVLLSKSQAPEKAPEKAPEIECINDHYDPPLGW